MAKKDVETLTIDYHCHLLPGIDDGAPTMDESLDMARILVTAGFTTVCCTPHLIKGVYEAGAPAIRALTADLQRRLAAAAINLRIVAGAEYYLDEYLPEFLKDPLLLDESKLLLIEISNTANIEFIQETLYRIKSSGLTPLVAHPERCQLLSLPDCAAERKGFKRVFRSPLATRQTLASAPSLLHYLQSIGCQFQGNIGSFSGLYGDRVMAQAFSFLRAGLYTHFGSDAHQSRNLAEILYKGRRAIAADNL